MNESWWQEKFPKGRQTVKIQDCQDRLVEISYGEKGTGKPLVFVHGLGMWSVTWSYNIDFFSQYFRVICVDNKGYGFSEKPIEWDKSGYKTIELKRVLEAICDEPPILIASSLWTTVCLSLVEDYPKAVARLVVIGATIFPKKLPTTGLKIIARLPMWFVRLFDRLRVAKYIAPLIRLMLRKERSQVIVRDRIPDEDIYWQAYPYIAFPNTVTRLVIDIKDAHQEIKKVNRGEDCVLGNIQKNLSQITCPTLIFWGTKDKWCSTDDAKELHRRIPNSQLVLIPNCGHDASSDCYEELQEAVMNFLKDTNYI